MIMGWNHKYEKAGWWLFFLVPVVIPLMMSIVLPLAYNNPVMFWILLISIFIIGIIIIWKRIDKKDKKG